MTATLEAAAKSPHEGPAEHLEVKVSTQPCERPFLDLESVYADATPSGPHAACVAGDGSINRIRVDYDLLRVYAQRVTDPTDPMSVAQWSTWTDVGGCRGWPPSVDICRDESTGTLYRFCTSTDEGRAVYWSSSSDHGATWSAWALVVALGPTDVVKGVAACAAGGTCYLAIGADGGGGGGADGWIEIWARVLGTWLQLAEVYPHDLAAVEGLGMDFKDAGRDVLAILYSAGGAIRYREWVISTASWGTGTWMLGGEPPLRFYNPRVSRLADEGRFLVTFVEDCATPPFVRPSICFTPVAWWITEEVPWRFDEFYGLEVVRTASHWYVLQADRAYRAPRYTGADGQVLTIPDEDLVAVEQEQDALGPGRLVVRVDNSSGRYDEAGLAGSAACARRGAQVALKLGYRTPAGAEGIWQQPYWITRVGHEHDRERGERYLTIEARDARGELEALKVRRAVEFHGQTAGLVVQHAWWRVCGRPQHTPHANLDVLLPYFVAATDESWGKVVSRALRRAGCLLRFHNNSPSGIGWDAAWPETVEVGASSPAWTLVGASFAGGAGEPGQPVREGRYWRGGPDLTSVEAHGQGVAGQALEFDALIWPAWRDTPRRLVDLKYASPGGVADWARWEQAFLGLEARGGEARVLPVPGLEVGDVVRVEEPRAGLHGATMVVLGLRTRLERRVGSRGRRGGFEQWVRLGGTL